MKLPMTITFRHMEPSGAVEDAIRERAEALDRVCDDITHCDVVVEAPHRHHRQGNLFHIRIDVTVPGKEIVVSREPAERHTHEDAYVAIHDAFDSMRRQLEDYVRVRRGKVKAHDTGSEGRVIELDPEREFGRIQTFDGREIYFHRNSLLEGSFDDLHVGSELRFIEEQGELGPQATSVRPRRRDRRPPRPAR